jgi:glyoxalase family protein
VHHVGFRVADEQEQVALRDRLLAAGLEPTPVIDRQYFRSVYFREPGGVLFELATDGPGFALDEPLERLGERLMLPPQYEAYRAGITAVLPELHVPADAWAHYRDAEG